MSSLGENREYDGSCVAKPFDIALMRVLRLRLSLSSAPTTLYDLLPNANGTLPQASMLFDPADCAWVEVEKLTKSEVKKKRNHGIYQ